MPTMTAAAPRVKSTRRKPAASPVAEMLPSSADRRLLGENTVVVAETAAPIVLDGNRFDVTRHDGRVTVHNAATGNHRTFRVETVRRGNLIGRRIVSVLVGADTSDHGDWQ